MGTIHIVSLFIFIIHVSLGREIVVDKDFGWTKVKGRKPYKLLSDVLSVLIYLLLNVSATIIKLFIIVVCVITTCIDIFTESFVIYVIQFNAGVLQMLVQELQDLFTLAEAILIMIQQMISNDYCSKGYSNLCEIS